MIKLFTRKDIMILTLVFYLGLTLSQASGSCLHPNMTWVSEDILDSVHPVETPYQCQAICVDTEGCAAFTWTTADNQQLQLHCFLFGSRGNQTSCQECVSGPGPEECSHQISTNTNTPAMEGKDSCHNTSHTSNRVGGGGGGPSHFRAKRNLG